MKKLIIFYTLLTILLIWGCYKIKDDYYYLPYPNAVEFASVFVIVLFSLFLLIFNRNRKAILILGFSSIIILFANVNVMNYLFEWHPLNLSLPFTKSQSFEVDFEPYQWKKTKPEIAGYNNHEIEEYLQEIDNWKRLRGLVVIKDDNLMIEGYFNGATKYSAFNIHSITKSITSTLIGIAIKKGSLKTEDELVLPFFNDFETQKDSSKLKIVHLLTMQGGFKGWDGPQGVDEVLSEGYDEDKIGNHFKYYTGSQMLLSAILTKATNTPTKDFANKELFQPLGIMCGFWRKVDGYYAGGDESYFTARDLARIGQLYLNKGNVNSQQLIDSSWVEKSFIHHTTKSQAFRELGCYKESGYGFCWWLLNYENKIIYTARGKGGQYILLLPEENIVIVILQEWNLQKDFKTENGYLCKLLSILSNKN